MDATGSLTLSVEYLRDLIAACPAWHDWTGSTGDDAAKFARARQFTHAYELPAPGAGEKAQYAAADLTMLRPAIMVDVSLSQGFSGKWGFQARKAANQMMLESGDLLMVIEDDVPAEYRQDEVAAKKNFLNRLGALFSDMALYAGQNGRINLTDLFTLMDPERADNKVRDSQGDFYLIMVGCRYGI